MKNVRVTIDEETIDRVDRVAASLGLNRSEVVRHALREWLHQHTVTTFERAWIAALELRPDEPARADDWRDAQSWGQK